MSILDLLKNEHSEKVDVPIEPGSTFDFRSSESKRTTLTDLAHSNGEPGEITDEHFPWVQRLWNTAIPSKEYFEITSLLAQIVDLLSADRQVTVPSDLTHTVNQPVAAQVALTNQQSITLQDISPFGYIYAPANPTSPISSYKVFKGYGTTDLIWVGSNQSPMSLRIPNLDAITILFDSDIAIQTNFQMYLSARPFQSSSSSGVSELSAVYPPTLSNEWYDTSMSFGGTAAARAMVADNYYTSYLWFPDNTPVKNVAMNVTVAGTAATVGRVSLYTVTNRSVVNINPNTETLANFLVQCADLPIDAIAQVSAPFLFTFKAKTLYIAMVHAQSGFTADGVTNQVSQFRSGIGSAQLSGFLKALAFGAPPSVINGVLGFLGTVPRIMFQAV